MNPNMFSIFGLEVKWYSFLILVGIILALVLIFKEAKRFNIPKDSLFNMCFWAIIFGILGARIYYVIFNISYYKYNLLEIFAIWNGGLAIHGGLIAGILTIYLYTKKNKMDFLRILDICAPAVLLAQSIGRWGNFFNSEAHGFATSISHLKSLLIPNFVINGMNIGGVYYLPTFYIESLWCLLGFVLLIMIRRMHKIKVGQTTSLYLMWYGIGRFFIEAWRTDSLMLGGFKVAQIISVCIFLGGLLFFFYLMHLGKYEKLYNDINKK